MRVDFVGKTESLVEDLLKALTLAKEKFDESMIRLYHKQNVSRKVDIEYTKSQKEKILEIEKGVINAFY